MMKGLLAAFFGVVSVAALHAAQTQISGWAVKGNVPVTSSSQKFSRH